MADTRPIGALKAADKVIEAVFQVDVAIHASGDLLAQPVKLEGAAFVGHQQGITTLMSVTVADVDDQAQNLTVVFADRDPGFLGALNAVPVIADALAADVRGFAQVTTWEDCGAWGIGCADGIGLTMNTDDNGDLWAWLLSKGTGTYAGGWLRVTFAFLRS